MSRFKVLSSISLMKLLLFKQCYEDINTVNISYYSDTEFDPLEGIFIRDLERSTNLQTKSYPSFSLNRRSISGRGAAKPPILGETNR